MYQNDRLSVDITLNLDVSGLALHEGARDEIQAELRRLATAWERNVWVQIDDYVLDEGKTNPLYSVLYPTSTTVDVISNV